VLERGGTSGPEAGPAGAAGLNFWREFRGAGLGRRFLAERRGRLVCGCCDSVRTLAGPVGGEAFLKQMEESFGRRWRRSPPESRLGQCGGLTEGASHT